MGVANIICMLNYMVGTKGWGGAYPMGGDGEEYRHAYPTRHCSHLRSRALEPLGVSLAFGVVHGHTLGGGGGTGRVTDLLFVHHES